MSLPFFPQPKKASRLQDKVAAKKLTVVDEKKFRAEVIARDKAKCRMCGRKLLKTISRVPERLEVHHLHGRTGDLRFDSRAALCLCLTDHERVTGKVNIKLRILPTKTFTTPQGTFTDARHPVIWKEI